MSAEFHIVGIRVQPREKFAPQVQEVLTKFGEVIVSRSGFHHPERTDGIITLVIMGGEETVTRLKDELNNIEGVSVQSLAI